MLMISLTLHNFTSTGYCATISGLTFVTIGLSRAITSLPSFFTPVMSQINLNSIKSGKTLSLVMPQIRQNRQKTRKKLSPVMSQVRQNSQRP